MYTDFLSKVDSYYKNILEDSIIEVASNTYAIIVFEHEATANVANNYIKDIEEQFEKIIGQKIKFVCISKEHWNRVAEEYKTNLKKKIKYEYIDELKICKVLWLKHKKCKETSQIKRKKLIK